MHPLIKKVYNYAECQIQISFTLNQEATSNPGVGYDKIEMIYFPSNWILVKKVEEEKKTMNVLQSLRSCFVLKVTWKNESFYLGKIKVCSSFDPHFRFSSPFMHRLIQLCLGPSLFNSLTPSIIWSSAPIFVACLSVEILTFQTAVLPLSHTHTACGLALSRWH